MLTKRSLWLQLHRWSGLLLGFLFVIAGLTGSAITFMEPLDRWLNTPSDLVASPVKLPPSEIIAQVERSYPNYRAERMRLDYQPGNIVLVRVQPKDPSYWASFDEVWVETSSGQIVSERLNGAFKLDREHLIPLIFRLHHSLFLDSAGQTLLGLLSIVWVVSLLAGVRLAWPKKNYLKIIQIKFSASRVRVLFDIHRAFGVLTLPILLVICLTGIYLTLTSWVLPVIQTVAATSPWPPELTASTPTGDTQPLEISIQTAHKIYPDGKPLRIVINHNQAFHRIDLLRPSDAGETPETVVFIDMHNGRVLDHVSEEKMKPGDKFIAWQYPLHTGEFLHTPGRIIWLVIGLTPLIFFITGLLLYYRKKLTGLSRSSRLRAKAIHG